MMEQADIEKMYDYIYDKYFKNCKETIDVKMPLVIDDASKMFDGELRLSDRKKLTDLINKNLNEDKDNSFLPFFYSRFVFDSDYLKNIEEANKISEKYSKDNCYANVIFRTIIINHIKLFLQNNHDNCYEDLKKYMMNVLKIVYPNSLKKEELECLAIRNINMTNNLYFNINKKKKISYVDNSLIEIDVDSFKKAYNVILEQTSKEEFTIIDIIDKLEYSQKFVFALLQGLTNCHILYMEYNGQDENRKQFIDFSFKFNNDLLNKIKQEIKKELKTNNSKSFSNINFYDLYEKVTDKQILDLSFVYCLIEQLLSENKKYIIDRSHYDLNYSICLLDKIEDVITSYIKEYLRCNDYIDFAFIKDIIKDFNSFDENVILNTLSNIKGFKIKEVDNYKLITKNNDIPSLYERLNKYFSNDINNIISKNNGINITILKGNIESLNILDDDEIIGFLDYLCDINIIKKVSYIKDFYFNISDKIEDPRINKLNEALLLKLVIDSINDYKKLVSESDKKELEKYQRDMSIAYNKLASAIITMPNAPYQPMSSLSVGVITAAVAGVPAGLIMEARQKQKIENYNVNEKKYVSSKINIDELRKNVYNYYYYIEEIYNKYKNVRDDWNEKKDELFKLNPGKKQINGCYIATAIYGSYDCPEVWTLRRFRDYYLDEYLLGRLFIKVYYCVSPTLVKIFKNNNVFIKFNKSILDSFVKKLKSKGYDDTKYIDKY